MSEKTKRFFIRYTWILLMDAVATIFYKVCSKMSLHVSLFAALGYLTLFLYPIIRGIVSYSLLKCIFWPNIMFFIEFCTISTLLNGVFPSFFTQYGILELAVFLIIPIVASATAAGVAGLINSINKQSENDTDQQK